MYQSFEHCFYFIVKKVNDTGYGILQLRNASFITTAPSLAKILSVHLGQQYDV